MTKPIKKILQTLKQKIKTIIKFPTAKNCNNYNATVLGMHNYYKIASNCSRDFAKIGFLVRKSLIYGTRNIRSSTGVKSKAYEKFYGKYNYRIIYIAQISIYPIDGVKTRPSQRFSPQICQYTSEGRKFIHEKLPMSISGITEYLLKNPETSESVEYNDNRISLLAGQQGKCYISGNYLRPGNMVIHRKIPKQNGGTDNYSNLVFITQGVDDIINEKDKTIAEVMVAKLSLNNNRLKRINTLRKLAGNCMI